MTLAGPQAYTVEEVIELCEKYAGADADVTKVTCEVSVLCLSGLCCARRLGVLHSCLFATCSQWYGQFVSSMWLLQTTALSSTGPGVALAGDPEPAARLPVGA